MTLRSRQAEQPTTCRRLPKAAPARPEAEWRRQLDTAFCSGVSHPVTIPAAIDRAQHGHGKKGVAALRRAVEAWTPGIKPGSPAEMRLLRRIAEDSDQHHNPRHWERDEPRQLRYAAVGWEVRRVGKHDLLPSVTWLDKTLARLRRRPAA